MKRKPVEICYEYLWLEALDIARDIRRFEESDSTNGKHLYAEPILVELEKLARSVYGSRHYFLSQPMRDIAMVNAPGCKKLSMVYIQEQMWYAITSERSFAYARRKEHFKWANMLLVKKQGERPDRFDERAWRSLLQMTEILPRTGEEGEKTHSWAEVKCLWDEALSLAEKSGVLEDMENLMRFIGFRTIRF